MKKLTCTTFLLLITLISAPSWASGLTGVKKIKISGLERHSGHMVSAFYVSARAPGFSTPGSRPRVREVLKKVGPVSINSSGNVSFLGTSFVESGWTKYNFVQIVVHSSSTPNIAIKNIDGSIPTGQSWASSGNPSIFKNEGSFLISRSSLESTDVTIPYTINGRNLVR